MNGKTEVKIFISNKNATIKIEPNFVLRGAVFKPLSMTTKDIINREFGREVEVKVLNFADIFGGKICAALDRQHPRDIFDIKYLLNNEGLTDNVRKAFVVYLISHPRPVHEILNPKLQDISSIFTNEFDGMANVEVKLSELEKVRSNLITDIRSGLTKKERDFLVSFKSMRPQWELLGIKGIENLPAVKWKLYNLEKMDKEKREKQLQLLKRYVL